MAKRNSDGDVLANQVNVMLANQQRILAALLGSKSEDESKQEVVREEHQEDDLKDEALGYDRLGVGGYVPKDIQDGSFTKRTVISRDKLLEQLMGRKAAKAHIAAKQAPRTAAQTSKLGIPSRSTKPEESDNEDESRAAMFRSKRRKTEKPKTTENETEEQPGEHEASDITSSAPVKDPSDLEDGAPKSKKQKQKQKPSSYLDEVLAERSKKKKKKKGKKDTT